MLNAALVKDVEFHTGAFPSRFGDRLSSVMDIRFREGTGEEFDGQLDLSFGGFGGVVEGPLGSKGSWLFSARRSFLDLIVEAIGEDTTSVPQYSDIQAKITYDIATNHKLSVLNLFAIDNIEKKREDAIDDSTTYYFDFDLINNTAGANWQWLWSDKGYSNTSISHTIFDYQTRGYETARLLNTGDEFLGYNFDATEQEFKLRNVNFIKLNKSHKFEIGFDTKLIKIDYLNFYGEWYDVFGNVQNEYTVDDNIDEIKAGGFVSYSLTPFTGMNITPAARIDHFTYNENTNISPRLSVSYDLTDRTSLSAAAGIYYQNLPIPLLTQNVSNKNLNDPRAYHYVLGVSHLLTDNTRLTIELYDKEYRYFPMDATQPELFIVDQIVRYGLYINGNQLSDNGESYARGVEMMVQKKLAKDLYGMISGSYSQARYKGLDGIWRDRVYDNRFNFNIEGGYKPNNRWEFSMRWIYAGGSPYTPFDMTASENIGKGIYDNSLVNDSRLDDYHSLNARFDRRFHFSGSNLIFYLSVWNAYGRKNISSYYWNEVKNEPEENDQWAALPIFGLEYEF
jgi:hypothetical protein